MTDPIHQQPTSPDEFDVSFRILGNEILGLSLVSQSRARNWAAFGMIVLVVLTIIVVEAGPVLVEIVRGA